MASIRVLAASLHFLLMDTHSANRDGLVAIVVCPHSFYFGVHEYILSHFDVNVGHFWFCYLVASSCFFNLEIIEKLSSHFYHLSRILFVFLNVLNVLIIFIDI